MLLVHCMFIGRLKQDCGLIHTVDAALHADTSSTPLLISHTGLDATLLSELYALIDVGVYLQAEASLLLWKLGLSFRCVSTACGVCDVQQLSKHVLYVSARLGQVYFGFSVMQHCTRQLTLLPLSCRCPCLSP